MRLGPRPVPSAEVGRYDDGPWSDTAFSRAAGMEPEAAGYLRWTSPVDEDRADDDPAAW